MKVWVLSKATCVLNWQQSRNSSESLFNEHQKAADEIQKKSVNAPSSKSENKIIHFSESCRNIHRYDLRSTLRHKTNSMQYFGDAAIWVTSLLSKDLLNFGVSRGFWMSLYSLPSFLQLGQNVQTNRKSAPACNNQHVMCFLLMHEQINRSFAPSTWTSLIFSPLAGRCLARCHLPLA